MATDPFSDNLPAPESPESGRTAGKADAAPLRPRGVAGHDVAVPVDATPVRDAADRSIAGQPAIMSAVDPGLPRQPGPAGTEPNGVLSECPDGKPAPAVEPPPPAKDFYPVFQDFRDEVSRQAGTDDAAQHMALAATYLEMGMEDDAIESLKRAARSPRHRFDAGAQLARLFKGRNDLTQAVEWMEHAAEAPAPSAEAALALLYDLGVTLEGMGESARALSTFKELQTSAAEYRDVAARVARLERVQTGG